MNKFKYVIFVRRDTHFTSDIVVIRVVVVIRNYLVNQKCIVKIFVLALAVWETLERYWLKIYEPRCEKTGLRGFLAGPTQTGCTSTEDG